MSYNRERDGESQVSPSGKLIDLSDKRQAWFHLGSARRLVSMLNLIKLIYFCSMTRWHSSSGRSGVSELARTKDLLMRFAQAHCWLFGLHFPSLLLWSVKFPIFLFFFPMSGGIWNFDANEHNQRSFGDFSFPLHPFCLNFAANQHRKKKQFSILRTVNMLHQ